MTRKGAVPSRHFVREPHPLRWVCRRRTVWYHRGAMPHAVPESPDHFHAVRFYQDTASLCHIVATFLGEGLKRGEPALVIATLEQRVGIAASLAADGFDVELFRQAGLLFELDAAETLARFMHEGNEPDRYEFFEVIGGVLQQIARRRTGRSIRAYGQMVDVLWQAGAHVAAVRVEVLWNQLAATHQFSLLCGYSMGNFYQDGALADICGQHTHVVSADGESARVPDADRCDDPKVIRVRSSE
jgi:DcmR-like sensory protein